jgi:hypothetical protein
VAPKGASGVPAAPETIGSPSADEIGRPSAEPALAPTPGPSAEPALTLTLGIDRRVSAVATRAMLDAAAAAGAHAVRLLGDGAGDVDEESREVVRATLPLLGAWNPPVLGVTVLLAPALRAGYADADPHLLHGAIAKDAAVKLSARATDKFPETLLPLSPEDSDAAPFRGLTDPAGGPAVAYLTLGPDATAGALADAVDRAAALGLSPLVVTGDVPGHPEGPVRLRDDLIVAGDARSGSGDAGLDKEVIRSVVRGRTEAVKLCYESAVARAPALAGKLLVTFEIAATGKVGKVAVDGGATLKDADLEKCVRAVVKKLVFPKPAAGPVTVTYPFVLETAGAR